jgi:hypothetical protein
MTNREVARRKLRFGGFGLLVTAVVTLVRSFLELGRGTGDFGGFLLLTLLAVAGATLLFVMARFR